MNIFKIFKRKTNYAAENMKVIRRRLSASQELVYKAVEELHTPSNGRRVARYLKIDSASVTPRLAELVKQGRLKVAYRKRSLDDGIWRQFYVVNKHSR